MLAFDDPIWRQLNGAYHTPYDATPALKRLEAGQDAAPIWQEFWHNLHHQGDVDVASYAVVPQLVRIQQERHDLGWNLYALASTIEIERHNGRNPPLLGWIRQEYEQAWRDLRFQALSELESSDDRLLTRAALATVAIANGLVERGTLILALDDSEIDALWKEHRSES